MYGFTVIESEPAADDWSCRAALATEVLRRLTRTYRGKASRGDAVSGALLPAAVAVAVEGELELAGDCRFRFSDEFYYAGVGAFELAVAGEVPGGEGMGGRGGGWWREGKDGKDR